MKKYVIFLDDEARSNQVFQRVMASADESLIADYECRYFSEACQCWDFIIEHSKKISIVFTDYLMPEVDGLTFLSEVSRAAPNAKCVIVTAASDEVSSLKAHYEYLFDVIDKGASMKEKIFDILKLASHPDAAEKV